MEVTVAPWRARPQRRRPLQAVLALAMCAMPVLSNAQTHYTFTKIADTVTDPDKHLDGVMCVGTNNLGTVVLHANGVVWVGNGAAPLLHVGDYSPLCPSINDSNEITHYVLNAQTNDLRLVRNRSGSLTTLASSTAPPYLDGGSRTYLASLSSSGHAVYQANGVPGSAAGTGLYIGPEGNAVVESTAHPEITNDLFASMNDNLVVAFEAFNTSTGLWGIYRGSAVPLVQDATSPLTTLNIQRPVINNAGTIAFVARDTADRVGVFKTDDGTRLTYVGLGGLQSGHERISINSNGLVAFDGALAAGTNEALFVGDGVSSPRAVIRVGDPLDGSTAASLFMWEEALNDQGQLTFWAALADGRWGVFRADPNHEPVAADSAISVAAGGSTAGSLRATDADGDALTYRLVTSAAKGTANLHDPATGSFSYVASAGASGTDTFTFRASDGFADSNLATVTVTIDAASCAVNITQSVGLTIGATRLDKKTGRYTQTVTVKNNGGNVAGPLSLVLDALVPSATVSNPSGTTSCSAPAGSPYVSIGVGPDNVFKSREKASVVVELTNPGGSAIAYSPRVLAGAGAR